MKKLLIEDENDGLVAFMGKRVLLMCSNYFYAGDLVSLSDTDVKLDNASLVYETGDWNAPNYKDAQVLPSPWYVRLSFVESFGIGR